MEAEEGEKKIEDLEKVNGDTTEKWLESKCVFCRQDLRETTPKLLPCFHSCCYSCVSGDSPGTENGSNGLFRCPICHQEFALSDAIDNYFMREAQSGGNENKNVDSQVPTCTSCEDNAVASSFCTDCGEWLCEACVQAHQRVRVTKDHTIRAKDDVQNEQASVLGQRSIFCVIHKQEQLKLFCETCDQLTCRDCQLSGHRDHKYQFVSEACKQQKAHIQHILACLNERKAQLEAAQDATARAHKDLVDREQFIRDAIKQFAMRIINEIGQRSRQLVKDLHAICGERKDKVSNCNQEVSIVLQRMEHSVRFVQDALEQGSDFALLYSKRTMLKQLIALQRITFTLPSNDAAVIRFVYDHQHLVNYIRNVGMLLIGNKQLSTVKTGSGGDGGGNPPAGGGIVSGPVDPMNAAIPQQNGIMQAPSPNNPHVTSSSQSTFRQQNSHLWNLLEKQPSMISGSSNNMNTFIRPSGTFLPPSGLSSTSSHVGSTSGAETRLQRKLSLERELLSKWLVETRGVPLSRNATVPPEVLQQRRNSVLQKMLAHPQQGVSAGLNVPQQLHPQHSQPPPPYTQVMNRGSVSIVPAVSNVPQQQQHQPPPNMQQNVVPNIVILPVTQTGASPQQQLHHHHQQIQQQQQHLHHHHPPPPHPPPHHHQQQQHHHHARPVIQQYRHAQHQPFVQQPQTIPNSIVSTAGTNNILVMSGAQRLTHFPQPVGVTTTASRGSPVSAIAGNQNTSSVVIPGSSPVQTHARPPSESNNSNVSSVSAQSPTPSTVHWVASPHSTLPPPEAENRSGVRVKSEKVSSTELPSCSMVDVTIKEEKVDEVVDDICMEMTGKALNDFCQESMDDLLESLRSGDSNSAKEAEAATTASSLERSGVDHSPTSETAVSEKQKVVQADSSSSPGTSIQENSVDNIIAPITTSQTMEITPNQNEKSETQANGSTDELEDKTSSESNVVDVTDGFVAADSEAASPQMPRILETRTLSGSQSDDPNEDWCAVCHDGGELLCCGKCPRVYHLQCHVPSLSTMPQLDTMLPHSRDEDNWQCMMCTNLDDLPDDDSSAENGKRKAGIEGLRGRELKVCERIVLELLCNENSPPFHEPVSRTEVPDYYKIITKPMDLEKIKLSLSPTYFSHYNNVQEFVHDLRLIFTNCYTFNEKDSDIFGAGKKLESFMEELLFKYLPSFAYNVDGTSENKSRGPKRKKANVGDPEVIHIC